MPPGGPYTLVLQGKKTIVFKDVLFGEVWVASEQSNMTYALGGATGAAEEIPKANYDEIRSFTVPKKIAVTPQEETGPAACGLFFRARFAQGSRRSGRNSIERVARHGGRGMDRP